MGSKIACEEKAPRQAGVRHSSTPATCSSALTRGLDSFRDSELEALLKGLVRVLAWRERPDAQTT